uniref:Regulatory protein zeste n=1 Tax=Plectus sambesii TaxID=2011161 RepID=A0A914V694_9BILA
MPPKRKSVSDEATAKKSRKSAFTTEEIMVLLNHYEEKLDIFRNEGNSALVLRSQRGEWEAIASMVNAANPAIVRTWDELVPCEVGAKKFGVFDPAPGSIVEDGTYVTVFCNPATHTADNSVSVARCSNGRLTSTSSCLPCPDDSWVYDATTNRCFKGFAAIANYGGQCDPALTCVGIGLSYDGVPGSLAYTSNLPALIEAGKIAVLSTVTPSNQYSVGIGDSSNQAKYKLLDGTPVSLTDLNPLFVSGQPDDSPANTQTNMVIRSGPNSAIGFDDVTCDKSFGAICQLQLSA